MVTFKDQDGDGDQGGQGAAGALMEELRKVSGKGQWCKRGRGREESRPDDAAGFDRLPLGTRHVYRGT